MNISLKSRPDRNRWEIHFSLTDPTSKFQEVWEWCWQTFGHPGTDPDTGAYSGWNYHGGWIYIFDEESVLIFTMRWS